MWTNTANRITTQHSHTSSSWLGTLEQTLCNKKVCLPKVNTPQMYTEALGKRQKEKHKRHEIFWNKEKGRRGERRGNNESAAKLYRDLFIELERWLMRRLHSYKLEVQSQATLSFFGSLHFSLSEDNEARNNNKFIVRMFCMSLRSKKQFYKCETFARKP